MTETISLELLDDLRRKNSALELVRLLAMAANEVGSSRRVYQEAVDRVCAHTTWPVGHVLEADESEEALRDTGLWHLDDPEAFAELRRATEATRFRAGDGLPGRVLESGEPLWIRDVHEDPAFIRGRPVADLGVRGGFAFPVLVGDSVAAVLEFYGREPAEPDRDLLDLMVDVGSILGRVVERERWERQITLRERQLAEALERTQQHQNAEREQFRKRVREQLARARAEAEAEELARLTAELERSNAELDQFAYVASHDLKAPLRGISNLSQWLAEDLEDKLDDQTREYIELLQGRIHRMEALIDGLLSYSRAGRVREEPEPVDVGELAREVVDLLHPPEGLEVALQPDLPTLLTERLPLQQVLHNLLSNAVKYGREEGARIAVEGRRENGAWEFSVQDNGPGIGPRYQERIWGMFQTLQPRDEVEGTGIGLALVKKIVVSRGGQVGLESEEGSGARFWFTWPEGSGEGAPAGREER